MQGATNASSMGCRQEELVGCEHLQGCSFLEMMADVAAEGWMMGQG